MGLGQMMSMKQPQFDPAPRRDRYGCETLHLLSLLLDTSMGLQQL